MTTREAFEEWDQSGDYSDWKNFDGLSRHEQFFLCWQAATAAALAAPATAPEAVAWLARYVGRSGVEQEYVSTHKNLADENDASGKAQPLYLHPPATAPEPMQLRQGECWPEGVMKQWDYYRDLIANGDTSSVPRDWFESLAEMRLIPTPATAPSWNDAPTVPGSYVLHCGNLTEVQLDITQDEIDKSMLTKGRWYGPIPADFDEKRWSCRADELLRIFDDSGDKP